MVKWGNIVMFFNIVMIINAAVQSCVLLKIIVSDILLSLFDADGTREIFSHVRPGNRTFSAQESSLTR